METVGKTVAVLTFKIPSRVLIRNNLHTLQPKNENIHVKLTTEKKKKYTDYKKM